MRNPAAPLGSYKKPYLTASEENDAPRRMAGKGAPRSTVFGVLGITKYDPIQKSLGGLVHNTKTSAPVQKGTVLKHKVDSDRHIMSGGAPKTHISGAHYGQVPYAGRYMGDKGVMLS